MRRREIVSIICGLIFANGLGIHNARLNAQARKKSDAVLDSVRMSEDRKAREAAETIAPPDVDCSDQLAVRDIQISLLQEAVKLRAEQLRLRDEEIQLLRSRLKYQDSLSAARKIESTLNEQLDVKRGVIHKKYSVDPTDYKLTFDLGWEKIDHTKHMPIPARKGEVMK